MYHLEIRAFKTHVPKFPVRTQQTLYGSRVLLNISSPIRRPGGPSSREMIGQHFLHGVLAVGHHGVPAYPGQMPPPAPLGQPQHHPTPSSNAGAQPTFIYQVLPARRHFTVQVQWFTESPPKHPSLTQVLWSPLPTTHKFAITSLGSALCRAPVNCQISHGGGSIRGGA